jgi:hypothetical protein
MGPMASEVDAAKWSGEGAFTQLLVEHLRTLDTIEFVRVEDARATRSEADYNFISNEIFVGFAKIKRHEAVKRFGFLPASKVVIVKVMTIAGLEAALTPVAGIGPPDYADETMLQYLRTERIVPPYQTRGYKLVELVRIYEVGTSRPS